MNPSALAQPTPAAVPVEYAEKAMGSLMKLHGELMEEKERRVDLYRRLMEKEQALAELKMYVKLLEEKVGAPKATASAPTRPEPLRVVSNGPRAAPRPPPPPARPEVRSRAAAGANGRVAPATKAEPSAASAASVPPAAPRRAVADGWKSW